jgi:DNA-binding transcriptional ArsR family regulator
MTGRKRTAYAAPAWAAEQRFGKQGGVGLHATLLTLANYADEEFSCFPSNERVAEETEQDERTVRRHIELLRELGLVSSKRRHSKQGFRTSDRHYLQLDVVVTAEQTEAARLEIHARKASRKNLPDTVSGRASDINDPAYRTPDADLTDTVSTKPTGHDVSEELLENSYQELPPFSSDVADATPDAATLTAVPRLDVEDLCQRLAWLIEANGSKTPPITQRWRDAARLMLDRDHRDYAKAKALIEWCQADEFWRSNIMSMPTFREKYDQLRLQALRDWETKHAGRAGRESTTDIMLGWQALKSAPTDGPAAIEAAL